MCPESAVVFKGGQSATTEPKFDEKKNQVQEFKFKTAHSAFEWLMEPNRAVELVCLNCGSVEDNVYCTVLLVLKLPHFNC